MKTLIKIPLILILLLLTSCSKDIEIENNDVSGKLEGIWIVKSYDYEGSTTSTLQLDITRTHFFGYGYLLDIIMVFSENPNNYSLFGDYFVEYYLTIENGQEYSYNGFLEKDQVGTWSRNGYDVSIEVDGINKNSFIVELTNTGLTIVINSFYTETEFDGTITNTEINETYVLERANN